MAGIAGWIGMLCLGACAAPLMLEAVKAGHTDINPWFLFLWLTGEVSMLIHVLLKKASVPLIVNYTANVGMVGVIAWYRWVS